MTRTTVLYPEDFPPEVVAAGADSERAETGFPPPSKRLSV